MKTTLSQIRKAKASSEYIKISIYNLKMTHFFILLIVIIKVFFLISLLNNMIEKLIKAMDTQEMTLEDFIHFRAIVMLKLNISNFGIIKISRLVSKFINCENYSSNSTANVQYRLDFEFVWFFRRYT